MKLISLWEPWATLMAIGAKRIETRSWETSYRGWLAIHASKGGLGKRELAHTLSEPLFRDALGTEPLNNGHIVAVVKLAECLPTEAVDCRPGVFDDYPDLDSPNERAFGDFSPGRYGWVTERLFRLPEPIPFKAMQGLCAVPTDVAYLIHPARVPGILQRRGIVSRISYSEDEYYPGQFDLFQANCRRSLHGKQGQEELLVLKEALLAMPDKRLIHGSLVDEGGEVCAIGAYAKHKRLDLEKFDPEEKTDAVGVEAGMPRLVAWKVVEMNDMEFRHLTPEARYIKTLEWIDTQLMHKDGPKP